MQLSTRQVHLDFHTSPLIREVGTNFSSTDFQRALKEGHVNSITVFAKCHHSMCYYPTSVGKTHPALTFDLLGEMIHAAHEIGVRAPIYITTGWSSEDADEHPEWIAQHADGTPQHTNIDPKAKPDDPRPIVSWKNLCLAGEYRSVILALTEEICNRYDAIDGLFYDICFMGDACYCSSCRAGMLTMGLSDQSEADAKTYYRMMRIRFMKDCIKIKQRRHPEASIFFNGAADPSKPDFHECQTHFEMEDLPTTWGGYDKMPLKAKYFAKTGKDYLGMTGKFHTMWGEFGGYKTPDALKYECALMLAYGAGCSVGDQLYPDGKMDRDTYRTIGYAYRYVEAIEEYCCDTAETSLLGIMLSGNADSDEGLARMLLETQMDFDVILPQEELTRFQTIILPDSVRLDPSAAQKFKDYLHHGGHVIMTGKSGLMQHEDAFAVDIQARYLGKSECDCDYIVLEESLQEGFLSSPLLFYDSAEKTETFGADWLASIREPYFNRTYLHYSSHQNTPNKLEEASYPAAFLNGNLLYIAHAICRMYHKYGAQYHREYFIKMLGLIYKKPVLNVVMPSAGRARLVRQAAKMRYVLHLFYASPIQRGIVSVIEDMVEIRNVKVELIIPETVLHVEIALSGVRIPFSQSAETIEFTVPSVHCHQMVTVNYR
ncbi:MAG: alpha-amylase family protein [Saccharofermentanales bacterium]